MGSLKAALICYNRKKKGGIYVYRKYNKRLSIGGNMQDLDMERLKKGEPSKEEIKEPEQKKVKKRCKRKQKPRKRRIKTYGINKK